MKRQVWLLFFCSALMHASIVGQAVMAALIGHSLAEDKTLSTLPVAIQMTATMAASIPAGIVFARLGRRAGFTMGAVAALLGSLTFAARHSRRPDGNVAALQHRFLHELAHRGLGTIRRSRPEGGEAGILRSLREGAFRHGTDRGSAHRSAGVGTGHAA